nr:MAG TPA: hypothetical protein [Caudoviricetes sp.]
MNERRWLRNNASFPFLQKEMQKFGKPKRKTCLSEGEFKWRISTALY